MLLGTTPAAGVDRGRPSGVTPATPDVRSFLSVSGNVEDYRFRSQIVCEPSQGREGRPQSLCERVVGRPQPAAHLFQDAQDDRWFARCESPELPLRHGDELRGLESHDVGGSGFVVEQ